MSLFIGNISNSISSTELEKTFNEFGRCKLNYKGTYAFAEFDNEKDAEEAMNHLQKKNMGGRELNIEWSKKSKKYDEGKRHRRDVSPRGRCFNCGGRGHFARDCKERRHSSRSRNHSRRYRHSRSDSRSHHHRRHHSRSSSGSSSRSSSLSRSRSPRRSYRKKSDKNDSRNPSPRKEEKSVDKKSVSSEKNNIESVKIENKDNENNTQENNNKEEDKKEEQQA